MNTNKKVKLVKALAFPASAAFMFGVGVTAIHADDEGVNPETPIVEEPATTEAAEEVTPVEYIEETKEEVQGTEETKATEQAQQEPTNANEIMVANDETPADTTYVAWIDGQGYETLEAAVNAATSGQTITLGEGHFTLYNKGAQTKGKDLTFIGSGADKTYWGIGATVPDPSKFGTEYNGDYSFDGAGIIKFQNMTLQSGTVDYLGFIRADQTEVENCTINGKTFYWGYTSATFKNTIFNAPTMDYALWTYSSPTMTFDNCTFNTTGKIINVYRDYAGAHYTINFKDCTVNNSLFGSKQVLNINDSYPSGQSYTINISGNNKLTGKVLNVDSITCSRLFGFGNKTGNNTGNTTVNIEGVTVFENGKRTNHEYDFSNGSYSNGKSKGTENKYTEGYKDDAYTYTYGAWYQQEDGSFKRIVTKVCNYCGETVTTEEVNHGPKITASDKTINKGDTFDPKDGVTASDEEDGDITSLIEVTENNVDTSKPGTYTVSYRVTDSQGLFTAITIEVTVVEKEEPKPDPETPEEPKKPETPEEPKTPETPSTPEDTKKEETSSPESKVEQASVKTTVAASSTTESSTGTQTGVETNLLSLGGTMIVSMLGALALRKKDEDDE